MIWTQDQAVPSDCSAWSNPWSGRTIPQRMTARVLTCFSRPTRTMDDVHSRFRNFRLGFRLGFRPSAHQNQYSHSAHVSRESNENALAKHGADFQQAGNIFLFFRQSCQRSCSFWSKAEQRACYEPRHAALQTMSITQRRSFDCFTSKVFPTFLRRYSLLPTFTNVYLGPNSAVNSELLLGLSIRKPCLSQLCLAYITLANYAKVAEIS